MSVLILETAKPIDWEEDKGELNVALFVDRELKDIIIMAFGKPLEWIGLGPVEARQTAARLIALAESVETGIEIEEPIAVEAPPPTKPEINPIEAQRARVRVCLSDLPGTIHECMRQELIAHDIVLGARLLRGRPVPLGALEAERFMRAVANNVAQVLVGLDEERG